MERNKAAKTTAKVRRQLGAVQLMKSPRFEDSLSNGANAHSPFQTPGLHGRATRALISASSQNGESIAGSLPSSVYPMVASGVPAAMVTTEALCEWPPIELVA